MTSSWIKFAKRQKRIRRAIEELDSKFEARSRKVPFNRNLFNDSQIKKIMRRRDQILRRGNRGRRARHPASR